MSRNLAGFWTASVAGAVALAVAGGSAQAQRASNLSEQTRQLVTTDAQVIALTHVKVIDGTGKPAQDDQTIVIDNGRISAVGKSSDVRPPNGAQVMDLTGHTVIPGLVGLHDHLYYTAAGNRSAQLTFSAPRLYLGSGVTTVRTTGSRAPYVEINLKAEVDKGRAIGPRIHITAPYITGGTGSATQTMTLLSNPEQARRFVAYWAAEGATWLKSYTNIGRSELKAAIDEAHKQGIKVTGHLCSVSFLEAVEMGIDGLEHGLYANSDYVTDKQPDICPTSMVAAGAALKTSDPMIQKTFKAMVDKKVPMTSTLVVYELFVPNRPTKDQRTLDAMAPEVRTDYLAARAQIDANTSPVGLERFKAAMAYEKAFVEAGGLLGAGVDPTGNGGALPGYGDQRNYELLIEAGFTPLQVVQIMSLNGARILGVDRDLGSVEKGKLADLVVLRGDLTTEPSVIRNTVTIFKDGIGFDSMKMLDSVKGLVGIR
ncbi:MAG: amidohydrolase family protein [Gemmatimonadota bacterium]